MTISTIAPANPPEPASPAETVRFPKAAIEVCLHDELTEAVKAEAGLKRVTLRGAPADVAEASFQEDSLVAVSILCAVEPTVGFELSDSVVRADGYASVDSALADLLPRIRAQWIKKGGKP